MSEPTLVSDHVLFVDAPASVHVETHIATARSGPSKSHNLHRVTKIQTSDTSISGENPINFLGADS
jgi:hypothetical protein